MEREGVSVYTQYGRLVSTLQMTCGEAVELLKEKQIDQVPILNETGYDWN